MPFSSKKLNAGRVPAAASVKNCSSGLLLVIAAVAASSNSASVAGLV